MKVILYILITCVCVGNVFAQQMHYYRNQELNSLYLNSSFSANTEIPSIILNHSTQWTGFDGHPIVSTIIGKYNFTNEFSGSAYIVNDIYGISSRMIMSVSGAYSINAGDFKINCGLSFKVIRHKIKADAITIRDEDAIINQSLNGVVWKPDADASVSVTHEKFYGGISINQIIRSEYRFWKNTSNTPASIKSQRHHFINGGYYFRLNTNIPISITPFANVYIVKNSPLKIDFAGKAMIKESFILTLMYSLRDAISLQIGYKYNDFISINYSYDIINTRIRLASGGSHEISIGINLQKAEESRTKHSPSF